MKQKIRRGRRILSFLLTLALVIGLMPGMGLTAKAAGGVSYQEASWNETTQSVDYTEKTATNPITLESGTTAWEAGEWYVVPANGVTISDRISVTGTVNLILTDGNTLTASKGITVADGNTLNIYAQSEGDTAGSLLINSVDNYHAGIGGVYDNKNAGTVNIHGGKITTKGGGNGAGIGGFWAGNGGNITIYGGTVDAEGGKYAAGIGGGQPDETGGNGGTVTIYGGTVTAKGSTDGGAGIGGGATGGNGGNVTINGGTVIATGGPTNAYGCGSMGIGGVCGKERNQEISDPMNPESGITITPPKNGSLTVNNGLKVYGGDSANPNTEITQEQLSQIYAESYSETTVYQHMIVSAPPHTHSLANYELTKVNADNDTITATCGTSDCPLDNSKATMTIIPKSDGTATITGDYAAFGVTDSNIITGESGGFKTASITVNGLTASISYGVNCITYADNLENGTISGDTAATVGATITPTITPATGYELKTLTVTPAQGSGVESVTVTGGTFVMPQANVTVSAEFQKIPYTISFAAMSNGAVTASKNGQPVSETNPANYGDTITLTATPDSGFALSSLSVKDSRNTMMELSGNGDTRTFTMPASNVTVSATFEGAPYNLTISNEITGGTVTASSDGLTDNGTKAKAGSEVTLTVTPDTGFNFESLTVTRTADSSAVSVTKVSDTIYKFTMPRDAVSVSATFVGQSVTASLNVTGNEGTTCTAAILDENYNEINSVTKKAGEKFILLVNRDNEYDFNVKNGENDIIVTEFTKEEYEAYLEYADKNKYTDKNSISVSANTVLAWVTMPGAEGDSVTLTVNFSKLQTFTILYQPAAETNSDIVACKIVRNVNNAEEVSYTFLQRGATMSDGTAVWSMKMTAAFPPTKIAFVPSSTPTTDEQKTDLTNTITNAALNDAIVSQNTSSWNNLSGAKYLIIGGNAKVVTAAFITDTSAMTTYKDNTASAATSTSGVTYQIAVCGTDASGNVTSFGTVKAPAAPTTAPEGKEFAGWRGFEYETVSSKATEKIYSAGATINVRENATFTAVWKPAKLKVNLDLGGGTGNSSVDPVTYGEKLPKLEDPTRSGFAFDGWTVSEAVTENGVAFAKGSTFDLDTPITANLNLTAQWKHVHSYTCYQISDFGDRLAKYQKYETALHIAVCGCGDLDLMAHEFDSNGKCACGYQKPGAQDVTLNISYGQWSNNAYTEKMQGVPETTKQGQEVSISAPPTWGNLEFSKWQYNVGDDQWVDLTAYNYASFIIPANMQVRALYINPVTVPQVDLSARKCDDQTEVNGQTYTMDNILFHLNYKLPDGYTFEDAGIRLGDNNGISYYFIQQVRYSYDNETKGILSGITVGLVALDYLTGNLTSYDVGTGMFAEEYSVNYLETEDNVLDKELDAATLAKYMYESKPVNVEKYDPIYWEAKAVTKGMNGSMETIPPLRFAQKYGGRHYIYGIGYLRYKDKAGKTHTIYTEALPTAVKDMPKYTVTATPDGKTNTKQN